MAFRALYAAMILAILSFGGFLIFKFAYEPNPVRVMKPTFFAKAEEIGAVTYRRFYSSIQQHGIVVFGIPPKPDWHQSILRGFMEAAVIEKKPFELILAEEQMPALHLAGLPEIEVIRVKTNTQTQAELIDEIQKAREAGRRTLIYMPSVFSTRILAGNPIVRYEEATGDKLFAISTGPLVLRPEQEFLVNPPCVGTERDGAGISAFGCAILQTGRSFYRKNVPQDQFVAVMNSPKPASHLNEDYLLLVSTPGQDQAKMTDNWRMRPVPPSAGWAGSEAATTSVESER